MSSAMQMCQSKRSKEDIKRYNQLVELVKEIRDLYLQEDGV